MRYSLLTTVPPTAPVATLDQIKAHLLVEHALDDAWLTGMGDAAARLVESYTGRRFGAQTVRMEFDAWPAVVPEWSPPYRRTCPPWSGVLAGYRSLPVELPCVPVTAVSSLSADTDAGTVAVTGYGTWLDHSPPLLLPPVDGWPALSERGRARVTFTCGLAEAPAIVVAAVQLAVGYWYRHRLDGRPVEQKLPPAAMALIDAAWVGRYV